MIVLRKMVPVLAVGLAIGASVGWAIGGRTVDVVDRVTELLEAHCMPFVAKLDLVTDGLQHTPVDDLLTYGDSATKLMVSFNASEKKTSCEITDVLAVFGDEDREAIYNRVEDWALEALKPLNGGDLVSIDLVGNSPGLSHILYRPRKAVGHFASVITYAAHYQNRTIISFGKGNFDGPIPTAEGSDV